MKRLLLLPAAALLALSACNDGPTGGNAPVVSVQVMPDERVLAVGETLPLDLTVRDEDGEMPSDAASEAQWSSDNPAVASVSTGGVVTGVAPGTTTIRAQVDDVSGSVQVTVSAAPAACNTPGAVRSLAVGGSVTLGGVQAATVCLDGGAAGAEYVAVPFHAGNLNAPSATVVVGTQGVVPVAASSPSLAPALSLAGGRAHDDAWHQRLQQRAGRDLSRYVDDALSVRRAATGPRPSAVLNLDSPTLGEQVQVNTSSEESCQDPDIHTGRVVAIGQRSIVLADVANPAGGLTDAEYASFAASFDTLVYPAVTAAFGDAGDVDQNGKVVIFYTRAVNELTQSGSGAYVGGFFHPRDLFPTRNRDGLSACAGSNYAEMFYMLVPDPSGQVNGNVFSRDLVLQTSLGTIAHEFQHLINASRRLYQVGTTHWQEETWLNEGLSHVAEEVLFYRASGLAPRQNIAAQQVSSNPRALGAFRSYMEQNVRRYEEYMESVESQSLYDNTPAQDANDLATRGAAWAFLRYAADRRAGTDSELWRALIDGSTTGFANLQRVLGRDPRPWIRDWHVSVFTDDVVPAGLDARYTQPSWRFRSFYTGFPLLTRRVASTSSTEAAFLKSGTGAFVRFGVLPATVATVTGRTNGNQPLPSSIYLTIVRTR